MGYKEGEYNFDLVNDADALELKVGTKKLKAVSISTSDEQDVYAFGDKLTDGTYPYVLTYTKTTDENEKFVLTFNVPVSNFNRVELTYSVKLVSAVTKTGTYGQYDRDGSQGFDGWYTNNYAVFIIKINSVVTIPAFSRIYMQQDDYIKIYRHIKQSDKDTAHRAGRQ